MFQGNKGTGRKMDSRKRMRRKGEHSSVSEEFVVNSEVWPCDIIRVDEDRDGFPWILCDKLLKLLGETVVGLILPTGI